MRKSRAFLIYLACLYISDALSISDYTASIRFEDPESYIGKDVKECGRALIYGIIPVFTWKDREKTRKIPVRIVGVPAEIRTGYLPNTSQKSYRLSQLVRSEPSLRR
jgi:hypothetical protein